MAGPGPAVTGLRIGRSGRADAPARADRAAVAGWRVGRSAVAAGSVVAGRQIAWLAAAGPVLRGGGGGAAVAFLQEIEVGADAQFPQGAGQAGGAQVQRPLLDMLPRGKHLIGGKLAGDHPGVAGVLAEPAHVRFPLGDLLAFADRLGIQLQDQFVRG